MSDDFFPVPSQWAAQALLDREGRAADYARSIEDADAYWLERAQRLDWITPPTRTNDSSFAESDFGISWFADGVLNVSVNCIDRHLAERGDQTAIIWEPDSPDASPRRYSYNDLHAQVCRFANVLKGAGVTKGDRVTIYLPMIPEAAFALLACARIGAIHSVVFGGFSPEALCGRIQDCDSRFVITADEGCRAGKTVPLKANVDAALKDCPSVKRVIVVQATGGDVTMAPGRDLWLHEEAAKVAADCPPEPMRAEDPLFILYTSGSTGKPKGVLHTSGGYLLWAGLTHELCFDYRPGDIYWCAADIGWVTGHSYIVYGALANGATTLMYEGVPNYPDFSRFWQIVDKYQVATFYAAPTALRALMREGDHWVIDGEKFVVLNGENADMLIVTARTKGERRDRTGVGVFLVPRRHEIAVRYASLDRDTDAITAGLTSLSVFYERTLVAVFWGALITALVWLAILPFALGLVVVGPWLGFASWHAYRGSVRVHTTHAA